MTKLITRPEYPNHGPCYLHSIEDVGHKIDFFSFLNGWTHKAESNFQWQQTWLQIQIFISLSGFCNICIVICCFCKHERLISWDIHPEEMQEGYKNEICGYLSGENGFVTSGTLLFHHFCIHAADVCAPITIYFLMPSCYIYNILLLQQGAQFMQSPRSSFQAEIIHIWGQGENFPTQKGNDVALLSDQPK